LEFASIYHEQKKDQLSKLIMTGDFNSKYANFTDDTIFQMIQRAKSKITIVSYFVWDGQDLFKQLSDLSKDVEIKFILDKPQEWKSRIIKNWNKRTLPTIFGINRKKSSNKNLSKIHSKIIIIDNSEILITSANLTSVAMVTFGKSGNNIETGIWSKDQQIVNNCINIFDDFERREIITSNEENWEVI
jgi:phosphatidylserine/phosphatidylglycerophosphate/cardiolipin synthase-like enzyme